jgi:hypothetical protein
MDSKSWTVVIDHHPMQAVDSKCNEKPCPLILLTKTMRSVIGYKMDLKLVMLC